MWRGNDSYGMSTLCVLLCDSLSIDISCCLSAYSPTCVLITFQNPTVARKETADEPDNTPLVITAGEAATPESVSDTQYPTPPSEYMPLVPSTRSWELKRTDINVIKIIGKGAFSRVAKATATGVRGVTGKITVAVKMLKGKCGTRVNIILHWRGALRTFLNMLFTHLSYDYKNFCNLIG